MKREKWMMAWISPGHRRKNLELLVSFVNVVVSLRGLSRKFVKKEKKKFRRIK